MEKRLRSNSKLSKAPAVVIDSCGEGVQDCTNPVEYINSITMVENAEAVKEMGRMISDVMSRQLELQQQREDRQIELQQQREDRQTEVQQQREEANREMVIQLVERQVNSHKIDSDNLTEQFERIRIDKEKERGRPVQTLVKYDGVNYDIDEWQERTEAVMTGNSWDINKLLLALPSSLNGQAKRAYDALTDEDKRTKDSFFQAMRKKIDPQAEGRNKDIFVMAKRGNNEGIMTYVDRLRMYIRRSGGDIKAYWATEMMKNKVCVSLSTTERKILYASVDRNEDFDKVIQKADAILSSHVSVIGAVSEGEGQFMYPNYRNDEYRGYRGLCWECNQPGHIARYCPEMMEMDQNQCGGQDGYAMAPPNFSQPEGGIGDQIKIHTHHDGPSGSVGGESMLKLKEGAKQANGKACGSDFATQANTNGHGAGTNEGAQGDNGQMPSN